MDNFRGKRDLTYWRWVYRTSGGWRGVRWCLNCLYGPRAWKRIVVDWWRDFKLKRMIRRMTPEQRAELGAILKEIAE